MKNLLVLLGKRIHELRAAKKWSQEEFAHVGGLHRTYIGQIERGEKNISFSNLLKVSSVLGVTLSELLAGLEEGNVSIVDRKGGSGDQSAMKSVRHSASIQKLVRRLSLQQSAIAETTALLAELTVGHSKQSVRTRGRQRKSI